MYPIQEVVDGLYHDTEGSVQISIPNLALWLVQPIPYQMNTSELEACEVSRWYLSLDNISARVSRLSKDGPWFVILDVGGTVTIVILVINN